MNVLPEVKTAAEQWRELCRNCNELCLKPGSWWGRIVSDPEVVPRVDESEITVRLRGNLFAEVRLLGLGLQCRIAPEHLLLAHPGSMTLLGDGAVAQEPTQVRSLSELSVRYDHVRRRACRNSDRRQAILDRLFLRHSCILAVAAPTPQGQADLVALSPRGEAVFFLLRRYADGDLRLKGRGGVVWRLGEMDRWLAQTGAVEEWLTGLLERCAALDTPHSRRYRIPANLYVHPHARLLIVDFDHAQRLQGLPALRADLEHGLDRSGARGDIHCLGDAGNISFGTFFSGI